MTDWTDPETFAAALDRADTREKGHYFEDFGEGRVIEHAPGLTLTRHANEAWMSQTLNHDPAFWRSDAAGARGFDEVPVHPDYLLAAVMGPTVEYLSEKGGYFLGRDDVRYHEHGVPRGTELRVESTVEATRSSSSRPEYGIVTWETRGVDADTGDTLVSYERTNMIPRRDPLSTDGGQSESANEGSDAEGNSPGPPDLPDSFVTPAGGAFEDFRDALDAATERDAAVAYRHERGRTMDAVTVA
jgi:2-methylfumaryl-CoA hydratase